MLQVLIPIWLIAFGLIVYLAPQATIRRFSGSRRRSLTSRKIEQFTRTHHFDERQQRWVRTADGVALYDQPTEERRFWLRVLGWSLLALWEGFWLLEIVAGSSDPSHPWQLPYVSLFFVLIVIPLAVYLFFGRRIRRLARRSAFGRENHRDDEPA
jgi:hypothetical protein